VHPLPYYIKGVPGGDMRNTSHEPSSYHLLGAPVLSWSVALCLSLSLPCGLPKGCIGDGNHHRDTPPCCRVSGSLFQSLYFRISAGDGVLGVIVVAVRVRVRGGAVRAVPESLRQDLHDLVVGYVVFDSNACAGA
jgi:hypothetical protein